MHREHREQNRICMNAEDAGQTWENGVKKDKLTKSEGKTQA